MQTERVLYLRKSEWNGADPELLCDMNDYDGNRLAVSKGPGIGTLCCLGIDLRDRHGFRLEQIADHSLPSSVVDTTDERFSYFGAHDGPQKFEDIAAAINDAFWKTTEDKVAELNKLYETIGVQVVYLEDE